MTQLGAKTTSGSGGKTREAWHNVGRVHPCTTWPFLLFGVGTGYASDKAVPRLDGLPPTVESVYI